MLYYRGTRTSNPMSDWGHAMFTTDEENAYFDASKNHGWVYDGTNSVAIENLAEEIATTWDNDLENGILDNYVADTYWLTVSGSDIAKELNPENIVDTAKAWDSEIISWIWERVLEPKDIMAVTTNDGAIVFDPSLIKPYKGE